MIRSLSLKNFMRHESLEVEFEDGLNLITGNNYSGKSSLLYAIMFAFRGPNSVPLKKDQLVTRGKDGMSVELTFHYSGSDYLIHRGKSTYISKGSTTVAQGSKNTDSYIEDLFGIPGNRFEQLCYSAQGETSALLTLGSHELHRICEDLGGVKIVDRMIKKIGENYRTSSAILKRIEEEGEIEVEELEEQLSGIEISINSAKADLQRHLKIEEGLTAQMNSLSEKINSSELLERSYKDFLERKELLSQRILDREESLKKVKKELKALGETNLSEVKATFNEANKLKEQADKDYSLTVHSESYIQGIESCKTRINDARKELNSALKSKPQEVAEDYVEELNTKWCEAFDQLKQLRKSLAEVNNSINNNFCSACKRALDESAVQELTEKKKDLEGEIAVAEKEESESKKVYSNCKAAYEKYQFWEEKISGLESSISSEKEREEYLRDEAHKKLGKLLTSEEVISLRESSKAQKEESEKLIKEATQRERKYQESISKQKEEVNLLRDIKEFTKELNGLKEPDKPFDVQQLKKKHATLKQERTEVSESIRKFRTELENYDRFLQTTLRKLEVGRDQRARKARAKEENEVCGKLQKFLKDNRAQFIGEIWENVLGNSGQIVTSLTDGAVTRIGLDEDGKFFYVENGEVMPVAAASGAQKSILGLSVLYSLGANVGNLPFLMLDEPSSDMDDEHSMALGAWMNSLDTQFISISHRPMDASLGALHITL